jgi:hypothetical protein
MFQVGTNFRRRSLLSYYHQRYMLTDVACPMCGKNLAGKTAKEQPVVQGQKFNLR